MSKTILTNYDFTWLELLKVRLQNLGSDPTSASKGWIYFNTTANEARVYNGTSWIPTGGSYTAENAQDDVGGILTDTATIDFTYNDAGNTITADIVAGSITNTQIGASAAIVLSKLATQATNTVVANNTGGTAVPTAVGYASIPVSSWGSATTTVNMGSNRIVSMADPSSAQDAATKAYVDAAAVGIDWKASVRVASTANITVASALTNASTIDGVTVATGDRVLLKNQTAPAENGIWVVVASGAASRATDMDAAAEVTSGLAVFVEEGTANADTGWVLTTNNPITLGTTGLTFVQFTGLGQITAGAALTQTGNTLDVAVAAGAGGIEVSSDALRISTGAAGSGLTGGGGSALAVNTGTASATGTEISGGTVRIASAFISTGLTGGSGTALSIANGGVTGTQLNASVAGNGLTGGGGSVLAVGAGTGISVAADTVGVDTAVVVRKATATIGDGTTTAIAVTHSLGTQDITWSIRDASGNTFSDVECVSTSTTVATFNFITAPTTNQYKVTIHG